MRTDFLVVGGGVIGLNIARELKTYFADATVTLIEKEPDCGLHASGRNSGVLHAGFYYSPNSFKAKFTRIGNKLLTDYCLAKRIPLNNCGKLVVARDARDLPALDELLRRGKQNGIELDEVSEAEAKRIEPRVKTYERALFSPTTTTVDPATVVQAMKRDAIHEGVLVRCGVRYLRNGTGGIQTSDGTYRVGYLVNAAGLYADRIAREWDFSQRHRILPFKGLYLYSDEPVGALRTNVYPVPDLKNPFLGVHFTVTAHGRVKIGPTAIPALWREQYRGSDRFNSVELVEILWRTCGVLAHSEFGFFRLAASELVKYSRKRMVALAAELVHGVKLENYTTWGQPGIRAQLVDIQTKRLEMDFLVEGDQRSAHVLNAVSPGFTCALPFANYVSERIKVLLNS